MATDFSKEALLKSDRFNNAVEQLYHGDKEAQAERFCQLIKYHRTKYIGDIRVFSSPGRIEIIGNHTDHNNGKVLCAAVTIDTLATVSPREDNKVVVDSIGFPTVEIDINDLEPHKEEYGTSEGLVRGVLAGLKKNGYKIGAFSASTTTNVFKGAGVSSSAAFEVLVAEICNVLFNDSVVSKVEKAIIAQYAENEFFGKPSGLMDQSAISLGGVSYIDFKNAKNPIVKKLKWPFDDVDIVIVNCGGDHCNLTPNYVAIRSEMEKVASHFGKSVLREVNQDEFYKSLNIIKTEMTGRAILRALHFYEENKRVDRLAEALKNNDETTALEIINRSGESSYDLLQNCYPEGDANQPIPLALAIAKATDGVKAARVHGGGFAGTILTVADKNKTTKFVEMISSMFGKENVFVLGIRENGTEEVQL